MSLQAEAELDETATGESDPMEADMLASFANDVSESQSTTTPAEDADASANPDETASTSETPASTAADQTTDQGAEKADDQMAEILSVLQKFPALEASIKKLADDVGGRVGSLEQVIKAVQSATPAGQTLAVSDDDFADLKEEWPELAALQVKALNKVLEKFKGTGISPDFAAGVVKDSQEAAEKSADARFLQRRMNQFNEEMHETHPDWVQIVGLPETDGGVAPQTDYRKWLKAQGQDYELRMLTSYSPLVVGRSIDKFHAWEKAQLAEQTKKTAIENAEKPSKTMPSNHRKQQLLAAVGAKSTATTPLTKKILTEEEAMLLSYEGKL